MKYQQFVWVAVLAGMLFQAGTASAQRSVAPYTKEAVDDLKAFLDKAGDDGFSMEAGTTSIFGGWLAKGAGTGKERWVPVLTLRNLDPTKDYRIGAAGDNDTKDLDLRVVDPAGKIVASDAATSRRADVTFRPARQQDYVIELRLYDSADNCLCVGAILRK